MGVHRLRVGLSSTAARFWTLMWLPLVLPALSQLPVPTNVTLTANQLSYILKWEPGPGTPTGAYYRVSFGTEREPSDLPVSGCQHVQPPLICNMSEAFLNLRETYVTKVTAHYGSLDSEPAIASGFKPIDHLNLPELIVTSCGRDLCVDLKPLGHRRETYDLNYELQINTTDKDRKQFSKDVRFLQRETIKDLAPGREYCVSVRFADSLENKLKSDFSHPVCAFTAGLFPTDPVISAAVCSLVIAAVAFLVLLVFTGFIHLKKRQLPSVLSTIEHLEEVLIITSCKRSSFLNVWLTSPSAEEKTRRSTSSDESDEDCTSETIGGSNSRTYEQRVGTYLLASSSSLSCSSKTEDLQSSSSNMPSNFFEAQFSPEGAEADSFTGGQFQEGDEEHEILVENGAGQDVNLLTLTFGRQEEVELLHDALEVDHLDGSEDVPPVPPPQTAADWCVDEDEEELDTSTGYMGRPHADV